MVFAHGDPVALRRKSDVTYTVERLVNRFADRVFDTAFSIPAAHHRQSIAVRRPIGGIHLLGKFSSSPTSQGNACQRSLFRRTVQDYSKLSRVRHVGDTRARQAKGTRLWITNPGGVDFSRFALPGSAVQHG